MLARSTNGGSSTLDQSGKRTFVRGVRGIVTRNTNSWSGNECFNNSLPRGPPAAPDPGLSQNLFSSSDRCNFALSWQRRVHRSSDVSPASPLSLSLSLSSPSPPSLSSICSQLFPAKLFAFQSAPFCRTAPSICSV